MRIIKSTQEHFSNALLDFNTVYLEKTDMTSSIGKDAQKKSEALLSVLKQHKGKTLIYAGTYSNVKAISTLLLDRRKPIRRKLLLQCADWLSTHYSPNWDLPKLIARGVGVHTGQLHRSLSQIQVRLFEEVRGIDCLISTSSIIEGVNTSAENVVLWSNKAGRSLINDFTYKNIIGRGGRMFIHFVGRIFVLEKPPPEEATHLELEFPDELLGIVERSHGEIDYSPAQIAKIDAYEKEMTSLVGALNLAEMQQTPLLQNSDTGLILKIAKEVSTNQTRWRGLLYLNSSNPDEWDKSLFNLLRLRPGVWEAKWTTFVNFVKVLSGNWTSTLPELLDGLSEFDVGIDEFFKLERHTTYKLATLLGDVAVIYNRVHPTNPIDLSVAIARLSHAFLPSVVFTLEEYGLPRMLSQKLHRAGVINFEDEDMELDTALDQLRSQGFEAVLESLGDDAGAFDEYVLAHFFDGIETTS